MAGDNLDNEFVSDENEIAAALARNEHNTIITTSRGGNFVFHNRKPPLKKIFMYKLFCFVSAASVPRYIEKHVNYAYLEDSNEKYAYLIDDLHTEKAPDLTVNHIEKIPNIRYALFICLRSPESSSM